MDAQGTVVEPAPAVATFGRSRFTWASIFGGTFVALGVWVLLGMFGLATGLGSVSPQDPSLQGVSTWLGIWSLIVPIIALFAGAYVATRSAQGVARRTGLLYGLVVWGLTTFIGALLVINLAGAVLGRTLTTAGRVVGGAGSAAASVLGGAAGALPGGDVASSVANWLNIDRQDILRAVNQQLPPDQAITFAQLQAALQDAANTALQQGQLNQEILVQALARNTPLSQQQVQQLAQQLFNQWNQITGAVTGQLQQAATAAQNAVLQAVNAIGNAFWFLFFSNLIALAAALAGGFLGSIGTRRDREERLRARAPARLEEAPAGT